MLVGQIDLIGIGVSKGATLSHKGGGWHKLLRALGKKEYVLAENTVIMVIALDEHGTRLSRRNNTTPDSDDSLFINN
jgi:hypothetical protein